MRQFGISVKEKESRVSGEVPDILVSFHSSGSTSNQWRKLKNPWFPGRTPFRPSSGTEKGFFAQLDQGAGPTCISYLAEEASDRSDFLTTPKLDQDLLSLYGQYRSTLVDHMDVDKAHSLEPQELERSLFHWNLPSSYLSFVCSRYSHLSRS
uniref:Ribosomal protein L10 n=1 Tax=Thalassia testudinum TaxID=55497 RepID=A0A1Z1R2F3_9LILI|nr:ribosomal protein L10 [Thalassia testudinum]